jgi:hypothetical protein
MFERELVRLLDDLEIVVRAIAAHLPDQFTEFCDGQGGGGNLLA